MLKRDGILQDGRVNEVGNLITPNLRLQVHVVFEQQLQDVHVTILTGCLHSSVSSTLPIHLPADEEFNQERACVWQPVSSADVLPLNYLRNKTRVVSVSKHFGVS